MLVMLLSAFIYLASIDLSTTSSSSSSNVTRRALRLITSCRGHAGSGARGSSPSTLHQSLIFAVITAVFMQLMRLASTYVRKTAAVARLRLLVFSTFTHDQTES